MSEKKGRFDLETQARVCALCPNMCRFLCPVAAAEKIETYTPRGKAVLAAALRRNWDREGGHGPPSRAGWISTLAWDEPAAAVFYHCVGCRACLEWCPSGVDVAEVSGAVRERASVDGLVPEAVKVTVSRLLDHHSLHGPSSARVAYAERHRNLLSPRGRWLYFAGCSTLALYPEIITATLRLMEAVGAETTMLDSEECCGLPLDVLGFRGEAAAFASRLAAAVRDGGFEGLVSGCPMCTYVLKERYPVLGVNLGVAVLHLSEFLAAPARAGALVRAWPSPSATGPSGGPRAAAVAGDHATGPPGAAGEPSETLATYHDPCYLGRYQAIYDAPRVLLTEVAGLQLVEMERHRELAACCGGGPALTAAAPRTATAIARARLAEAGLTGAGTLITACPHCLEMLRPVAGETSSSPPSSTPWRVLDLAEVLAARLAGPPGAEGEGPP